MSLGIRLRVAPFIQDLVLSPDGAPRKNGLQVHHTPAATAFALRLPYAGSGWTQPVDPPPVRRM